MKGFVLPDDYMDVIREFLGVDRIQEGYGMSEISTLNWACDEGRYHVQPWVIPFVLDPDTSEPLPRTRRPDRPGRVLRPLRRLPLGRRHLGRRDHDRLGPPCPCGRTSVTIAHDIVRYSEKQGVEDDRISCSATQRGARRGR